MRLFFGEWIRVAVKLLIPFIVAVFCFIWPILLVEWGLIGWGLFVLVPAILIYCAFIWAYIGFWRQW